MEKSNKSAFCALLLLTIVRQFDKISIIVKFDRKILLKEILEMEKQENGLKSSLKTRHIVMMSLGGAIGAGLFAGTGSAIAAAGPAVILSYFVSGLILFIVMHGVGKIVLAQKEKSVGMSGLIAPYVGNRFAHFTDWVYWATWMAVVVAEAAAIAQFLQVWWPHVPAWVFYLIVAVLTMGINLYSVRAFAETEYWLSWTKTAVIVVLIILGILVFADQLFHMGIARGFTQMDTHGGFTPQGMKGIFNSMLIVIYSYGGSELAAITVAETENPKVAIPKAIRGVMFRVVGFYIVPIFLFLELYSWKFLATTKESPFALIFTKFHIPFVANIINLVIIVALFSVINSSIYVTSRSLYSRSVESKSRIGQFFGKLSGNQVPLRAIIFSSCMLFVGVILSMMFQSTLFFYVASSISYTLLVVWLMLLITVIIFYFKNPNVGTIWLKTVSIITLIVLIAIGIGVITQNPWGVSVFAVVVCIVSLLSYRKK